ncbi:MAG: PEP-CTERM sorting domain-containing protein, partial [Alphaproteobacteria bacterium]
SLSGNLALIGAQADDAGTTNSGAAYLFDALTGGLLRTFTNPTPGVGDNFGHSVALSGTLALISATGDANGSPSRGGSGAAYLYDTTTGLRLQTFLNPTAASGDNFGFDVALFGNRALVSTINDDTANTNAGAAYLFDTDTGTLLHTFLNPTPETNNVFGNNDNFGFAIALSATMALIGAPNDGVNGFQNGVAYLYDLTTYDLLHTLAIPTPFTSDTAEFLGNDVALSGNCALAGAPFRNKGPATSQKDLGAAFFYDAKTGAFLQEVDDTTPNSNDRFGFAVALDGCNALIGAQTDLVNGIRSGQVFSYIGPAPVPEPGTAALLVAGLLGLGFGRRRFISRP